MTIIGSAKGAVRLGRLTGGDQARGCLEDCKCSGACATGLSDLITAHHPFSHNLPAFPSLQQNADVWDWELSEEAMAKLNGIAHQQRMVDGSFWLSEEGPYKTLSDLWDEP